MNVRVILITCPTERQRCMIFPRIFGKHNLCSIASNRNMINTMQRILRNRGYVPQKNNIALPLCLAGATAVRLQFYGTDRWGWCGGRSSCWLGGCGYHPQSFHSTQQSPQAVSSWSTSQPGRDLYDGTKAEAIGHSSHCV